MAERLPRDEKKARTRQALLSAAAVLIASYGAEATSLERIAEEAGFTKGAIYSNFSSKEDLILALAEAIGTNVALTTVVDGSAPLAQQFEALGRLVAREARTISRTAWRLNLEMFQFLLRNGKAAAIAKAKDREGLREDGRVLEAIAASRGESLPMSGAELMTIISALALGLAYKQALDPAAVPDEVFAKAFRLLAGGSL